MDLMQPYRLEMATKGLFGTAEKGKNGKRAKAVVLSEFWKPAVTSFLKKEMSGRKGTDDSILLNLASDEYSSAVDSKMLVTSKDEGGDGDDDEGDNKDGPAVKIIKVDFKEEGKVISVHAKRARGLMVRYLALNNIQTLEGIKEFNEEGYKFVEEKSTDDTLYFDRTKQPPKPKEKAPPKPKEPKAPKAKAPPKAKAKAPVKPKVAKEPKAKAAPKPKEKASAKPKVTKEPKEPKAKAAPKEKAPPKEKSPVKKNKKTSTEEKKEEKSARASKRARAKK